MKPNLLRDAYSDVGVKDAVAELTSETGVPNLFIDVKNNKPWKSDQPIRRRIWIPVLPKADLEYRNPYQTRHTYASMMLSEGRNPLWVAQQRGHADWGMIRITYGRWISKHE